MSSKLKLTKRQIEDALRVELRLEEPLFVLESAGAKVSGSVVSSTFRGKSDAERQRMMWHGLERRFGPAAVQGVGAILAFTPEEWNFDEVRSPKNRHAA